MVPLADGSSYFHVLGALGTSAADKPSSRYRIQMQSCDFDPLTGMADCDLDGRAGLEPPNTMYHANGLQRFVDARDGRAGGCGHNWRSATKFL